MERRPHEPAASPPPPAAGALPLPAAGALAAAWGIGGVGFLLVRGAVGLLEPAREAFLGLSPGTGLLVGLLVVLPLGALKGLLVFQRNLAPRVVGRALHLARRPSLAQALLAPLYCLGLLHATRRRMAVGWTMLALIAGFVAGTRLLAQPYRGVVAASVALGLAWGAVALAAVAMRAWRGAPPRVALDLPGAPRS